MTQLSFDRPEEDERKEKKKIAGGGFSCIIRKVQIGVVNYGFILTTTSGIILIVVLLFLARNDYFFGYLDKSSQCPSNVMAANGLCNEESEQKRT